MRKLFFALALALACAQWTAATTAAQTGAAAAAPESRRPSGKQGLLWRKMEEEILKLAGESSAVVGVAVLDLTSGDVMLHNADEVFATASSIKIAVLAELYRQEERAARGTAAAARPAARLTDLYTVDARDLVPGSDIMAGLTPGTTRVTNRDLATFMVAVSDNAATNVLIDRVGMEQVNSTLDGLGLRETRLRRRMLDLKAAAEGRENTSTPREMVRLLEALYGARVFGKTLAEDFFRLLSTNKDGYLTALLPEGVRVANKPGWLEAVRTDSGVVFVKNRPFAVSVMTAYARDERAARDTIGRIALAAYHYFDLAGRASPYGRVVSPR